MQDLQDGLPPSPSDAALWDTDLRRTALLRSHRLSREVTPRADWYLWRLTLSVGWTVFSTAAGLLQGLY